MARSVSLLLSLLLFAGCAEAVGEDAPPAFPDGWCGRYHGLLTITAPGGRVQDVPTDLHIEPTDVPDRYAWRLRYAGQPWRDYELVVRDAAEGRYDIDEKNGIVLPAVFLRGELVSVFSVLGSRIAIRYRHDGEAVHLDLLATTRESRGTTGGVGGVPEVAHYGVQSVQHGVLAPVVEGAVEEGAVEEGAVEEGAAEESAAQE